MHDREQNALTCDHGGCTRALHVGRNETTASARERAAHLGWTLRHRRGNPVDFCPKHS